MFKKRKRLLDNESDNIKQFKEEPLEKGDTLALIIAALITLLPAVLLLLGALVLIIWLIF